GTNNGYAMAWGGNAYNSRNAGDVYASSYNHGGCLHAFAQGGDAEDGNAGYARAWSHVLTEAFGGNDTGTGNGGNAMAGYPWATTPSPGPMTARSGDAVSGNGGQGYVYLGAEVYAYGGI